MEPPILIVIQPAKLESYAEVNASGELVFSYRLPHSFNFREPHFVKAIHLSGTKIPLLILTSFSQPQSVNTAQEQVIGTNFVKSNIFVPLAGNYLPFSGFIKLRPLPGQAKVKDAALANKLTLILQIASESWIRGNGDRRETVL